MRPPDEEQGWSEIGNGLVNEYKFADFKSALAFVNKVGELAEAANHHPDIELGWGRVKLTLTTHSAGSVTDQDRELAKRVDDLARSG